MKSNFSVVILSAGNSSRMGVPKLGLKYSEKTTFLENILEKYLLYGCNEIVVVVNQQSEKYIKKNKVVFPENVKIVINKNLELDRFYSVKIGLQSLEKKQATFIVNVDNPFVDREIIYALLNEISNADFVYPSYLGKGGHPVLLSQKIVNDIVNENKNHFNFKDYLQKYSKKIVEVNNEMVLVNINTLEEYNRYFTD